MQFILKNDDGTPRVKRPAEKFPVAIDFTPDLEVGDTASTRAVVARDSAGTDVTSAIIDSHSLTGATIAAVVKAGTSGEKYRVIMTLTTTLGRVYEHEILIPVESQG